MIPRKNPAEFPECVGAVLAWKVPTSYSLQTPCLSHHVMLIFEIGVAGCLKRLRLGAETAQPAPFSDGPAAQAWMRAQTTPGGA